jgi:hypothetical protein
MNSRTRIRLVAGALCLPALASAFPPGAPMSDFGPSQVSLSAYFDHSGQDLFLDPAASVFNSTGMSLDYGPWPFIQVGLFGGATELDVALSDTRKNDSGAYAFNTDYALSAGASLKLATPRFAGGTTRAVAYGAAMYFDNEDAIGNGKLGMFYNTGATLQYLFRNRLNLVVGGEFFAVVGEQRTGRSGGEEPFGLNQAGGTVDMLRGVVGVEWYFKGKNNPFVSVAFRPSGSTGWDDDLGLRGGSISVSLGAMATLGKQKPDTGEDESGLIDE